MAPLGASAPSTLASPRIVGTLRKATDGPPAVLGFRGIVSAMLLRRRFFVAAAGRLYYWRNKRAFDRGNRASGIYELASLDLLRDTQRFGETVLELHFAESQRKTPAANPRDFLILQAASAEENLSWAEAIAAEMGQSLGLPHHWDPAAMLQGFRVNEAPCHLYIPPSGKRLLAKQRLEASDVKEIQRLVESSWIKKTTRDRTYAMANSVEVLEVLRVQNASVFKAYQRMQEQIRPKVSSSDCLPSKTIRTDVLIHEIAKSSACLPQLDDSVNERWLFHGTCQEAIENITDNNFKINRAVHGRMYGSGVYLAECSSKSDEYTKEVLRGPRKGLRCLLLCRATLGSILYDKAVSPNVKALQGQLRTVGYNSILGDRLAARGTFREFIVSHEHQVYPNFIIYYKPINAS